MECKAAEELIEPFLLGALEQQERDLFETHLSQCRRCSELLKIDGETIARLATFAPQLEAPARVRCKLMRRVDKDLGRRNPFRPYAEWLFACVGAFAASQAGRAAASALVICAVAVGIWMNFRPASEPVVEQPFDMGSAVPATVASPIARQTIAPATAATLRGQPTPLPSYYRDIFSRSEHLTYVRGTAVNALQGTGWTAGARGMMLSSTGKEALLVAKGVPPPPAGTVYQIWLIKDETRYRAGILEVDSTGYGEAVIIPTVPLIEFDAIGITIEPLDGKKGPTGVSVMKGDL